MMDDDADNSPKPKMESKAATDLSALMSSSRPYESYWKDEGFSPWQELQLYLKIVACHASHLSHLLDRRASQVVNLHESYVIFSGKLLDMSNISLSLYYSVRSKESGWELFANTDEYLQKCAMVSTHLLRDCIRQFRTLDTLCRVVHPQPGVEKIAWDMVALQTHYSCGQLEGIVDVGTGATNFLAVVECASNFLSRSKRFILASTGTGLPEDTSMVERLFNEQSVITVSRHY